jgi:hypothetical protein
MMQDAEEKEKVGKPENVHPACPLPYSLSPDHPILQTMSDRIESIEKESSLGHAVVPPYVSVSYFRYQPKLSSMRPQCCSKS